MTIAAPIQWRPTPQTREFNPEDLALIIGALGIAPKLIQAFSRSERGETRGTNALCAAGAAAFCGGAIAKGVRRHNEQLPFKLIVEGKAGQMLLPGKRLKYYSGEYFVSLVDEKYHLAGLGECACAPLSRSNAGQTRAEFESRVVANLVQVATTQKYLRVTFFASGHLFSEFVILVKLCHRLNTLGLKVPLHLYFIDPLYESNERLRTALDTVSHKLGTYYNGPQPKVVPFKDASHYIACCSKNLSFWNDTLVAIDCEDRVKDLNEIAKMTQIHGSENAALLKVDGMPRIEIWKVSQKEAVGA